MEREHKMEEDKGGDVEKKTRGIGGDVVAERE